MSDDGEIHSQSTGGIVADHPERPTHQLLVGPSLGVEFNTLQARITPLACWRIEDIRFAFDASFPLPPISEEMSELKKLIDKHTLKDPRTEAPCKPSLSIFGHADPTGNDDYNKRLSGRRATAIYGVLTRDTELWEELFADKSGGDDWGTREIQVMLERIGHAPGSVDGVEGEQTRRAIRDFQGSRDLEVDGKAGPRTREAMYMAYMESVCVDGEGVPFSVQKRDFLAKGLDPDGKADYQGCGEFNPVLMFSKEESEKFKKNKTQRDQENAPNRRVMVFLFRAGIHVDPGLWPCPRARQGITDCEKRFWSDATQRRKFQDSRREFKDTEDTFACRFYHRLASHSPCERAGRPAAGEGWIIRVESAEFEPDDAVVLESPSLGYRHSLTAAVATSDGDFLEFNFPPGPEGDYVVSVTLSGVSYIAWRGLHLPSDDKGVQPPDIDYAADAEEPNVYSQFEPDGEREVIPRICS